MARMAARARSSTSSIRTRSASSWFREWSEDNLPYSPASVQSWNSWNYQYVTGGIGQASNIQCQVTNSASSSDTNIIVWYQWNQGLQGLGQQQGFGSNQTYQNQHMGQWSTPEELAQNRSETEAIERKIQESSARAEELLLMFLSSEQKRQYRLYKGRAGNVRKLTTDGREEIKMCVHPEPYLPDHDNVLAQFLALHTDEAALVRTANQTRLI